MPTMQELRPSGWKVDVRSRICWKSGGWAAPALQPREAHGLPFVRMLQQEQHSCNHAYLIPCKAINHELNIKLTITLTIKVTFG